MEKKINRVLSILPINRQMNAVYLNEDKKQFERPIVSLAQVLYIDGGLGFELMDLSNDGKTLFVSSRKGFRYVKEIKESDKNYTTERDLEIMKNRDENPFKPKFINKNK